MYLIIFDDNSIRHIKELDEDLYKGVEDRYIEIIDISSPINPLYYNPEEFKWENVEKA